MHRKPEWALVADAQHARILERRSAEAAWAELEEERIDIENPRSHELGNSQPGRVFDSQGGNRHAIQPRHDPHEAAKEAFARRLAERLEQAASEGRFGALWVAAAPHFLGSLRQALGDQAQAALRGTLDKDLVKQPLAELAPRLEECRPG